MTDPALGVGVIGAGSFGHFVSAATATLPEVEIVAVTDTDPERARRLAASTRRRSPPTWTRC